MLLPVTSLYDGAAYIMQKQATKVERMVLDLGKHIFRVADDEEYHLYRSNNQLGQNIKGEQV